MGTASLICVWYKGRFAIAQYCKWNGGPAGQGTGILQFLLTPGNIERLEKGLEHVYLLSHAEVEELKRNYRGVIPLVQQVLRQTIARSLENQIIAQYFPCLFRDMGAEILEIVATATAKEQVPVEFSLEFANNVIYCEWAYVVNLDDQTLEVFCSSEGKDASPNKRFNEVGDERDWVPSLCKTIPFDKLSAIEEEFVSSVFAAFSEKEQERSDGDPTCQYVQEYLTRLMGE